MKISKRKGQWLRRIKVMHSPKLTYRNGRRTPLSQEKAFIEWALAERVRDEQETSIRQIVAYWKPLLQRYLIKVGFKEFGGTAKVIGSNFVPPSRDLAEAMKALLSREPTNESAKFTLRMALCGRTKKRYLFIDEAFDSHPIANATWVALESIKDIESALATDDADRAGAHAFKFGRALTQAHALHAREISSIKASRSKRSLGHQDDPGYEPTCHAWHSYQNPKAPNEKPTATWLLSTMHGGKTAEWDTRRDRVRFRRPGRRRWERWGKVTTWRNKLTAWKKTFTRPSVP